MRTIPNATGRASFFPLPKTIPTGLKAILDRVRQVYSFRARGRRTLIVSRACRIRGPTRHDCPVICSTRVWIGCSCGTLTSKQGQNRRDFLYWSFLESALFGYDDVWKVSSSYDDRQTRMWLEIPRNAYLRSHTIGAWLALLSSRVENSPFADC